MQKLPTRDHFEWSEAYVRWFVGVQTPNEADGMEVLPKMQDSYSEDGGVQPHDMCDARVQLALLLQVRQTDCGNVSENIVVCDYGGILSMLSVM